MRETQKCLKEKTARKKMMLLGGRDVLLGVLTHLGGNHQRRGMDVEWAQLVGHDHIVDVLLSCFLQLKYDQQNKNKEDVRTSKEILLFLLYNAQTSVMRHTSTLGWIKSTDCNTISAKHVTYVQRGYMERMSSITFLCLLLKSDDWIGNRTKNYFLSLHNGIGLFFLDRCNQLYLDYSKYFQQTFCWLFLPIESKESAPARPIARP